MQYLLKKDFKNQEKLHKCKIMWGKVEIKHSLTTLGVMESLTSHYDTAFSSTFFDRKCYLDAGILVKKNWVT